MAADMHVQKLIRIQHHQPICVINAVLTADLFISGVLRNFAGFQFVRNVADIACGIHCRQKAIGTVTTVIRCNDNLVKAQNQMMRHPFQNERAFVLHAGNQHMAGLRRRFSI